MPYPHETQNTITSRNFVDDFAIYLDILTKDGIVMKCSLCDSELANGWWCNKCKLSVNWIKYRKEQEEGNPYDALMVGLIILVFMTFFVVAFIFTSR